MDSVMAYISQNAPKGAFISLMAHDGTVPFRVDT